MQTTIYRTGLMKTPSHGADVLSIWHEFDVARPEGHTSRREALFSAPDIHGGHKWLYDSYLSKRYQKTPFLFNEVIVESDNVRVYNVYHYEVAMMQPNPDKRAKIIADYWNTSMTLTEWMQKFETDPEGEWEILLPEKEVISSQVLTYPEIRELYIQENLWEYSLDRLDSILRPHLEELFVFPLVTN